MLNSYPWFYGNPFTFIVCKLYAKYVIRVGREGERERGRERERERERERDINKPSYSIHIVSLLTQCQYFIYFTLTDNL